MPPLILVSGVTGYVGGRLVPKLLAQGYSVRCLARDCSRLQGRSWWPFVETCTADVLQPKSLGSAFAGVKIAYYLIHSMSEGKDFAEKDVQAARNFAQAAKESGVERIIYLGGLGQPGPGLSPHLNSRHETAQALREAGVPVTEFRAGVIVGSGSFSFEMVRYLTERVPVMICPKWVFTRTQPIAIRDILDYLTGALQIPESIGQTLEIGGQDVVTYGQMMSVYADVRRLQRFIIPVPFLTPRLSSYWVHLVTPIPAYIARPLIDGLKVEVVVHDHRALQIFPDIQPMSYRRAVRLAVLKLEKGQVETAWSDALITSQRDRVPNVLVDREGMISAHRQTNVDASAATVFQCFTQLGGNEGWLFMNWAWQIRGWMDRLIGGVGMRRGRRDPLSLRVGDAIDFWRVEALETGRMLRLRAEMIVPGKAWLEFVVEPVTPHRSLLRLTAFFAPKGLLGLLYWYLFFIPHQFIFPGMLSALKKQASARARGARLEASG